MSGNVLATTELISGIVVIGSTIISVFAVVTRQLWKTMKKLNFFFVDFYGEPARPGVPSKPGVVERIGNLELATVDTNKMIEQVLKETRPNGGSSMRDEIQRVHREVVSKESAR